MLSEFGCCPDMIYSASGPNGEGCSCENTDFGCCPDDFTAARGPDNLGCGCTHSPFGCCPDQVTLSPGKYFQLSLNKLDFFIIVFSTVTDNISCQKLLIF